MTTQGKWEYNNIWKYKYWKYIYIIFLMLNTNVKHFVSMFLANGRRKKYQGGLVRAWNAFILNVFTSMGYIFIYSWIYVYIWVNQLLIYVFSCIIVLSFTFLVVIILMRFIYMYIYECIRLTSNLARCFNNFLQYI